MPNLDHYRRLLEAYLLRAPSHLDFWRDEPQESDQAVYDRVGPYYLSYRSKADYAGPRDAAGIPLLHYRGGLGLQYNPIATAQYGLAHFNRYRTQGVLPSRKIFLQAADWLQDHLETNPRGRAVWQHHFRWPYRKGLQPPWASALAQGQGISVLVRAAEETGERSYLESAEKASEALMRPVSDGGLCVQEAGGRWLEEYPVDPPSHILNGAICAGWGLFDLWLATRRPPLRGLFDEACSTLLNNLPRYDAGFWSLYELPSDGFPPMVASPYYHRLHIVQLRILAKMTGERRFHQVADRWEAYQRNRWFRARALFSKGIFKLCWY